MKTNSIINTNELYQISNQSNLRIFDVRTGPNAKEEYQKKHLKNAVFVDLNHHLAEIDDPKDGGRHPLPKFGYFIKTLGRLGIDKDSDVVIYDDKNGANAGARFWWMLKAAGHKKVRVLNGGLQFAESQDYPLASGDESYPETEYISEVHDWQLPQVWIDDVKGAAENPEYLIVDVRESQRYKGITEPIDLVAGHIPSAENFPFSDNLDENGLFKSPEILNEKYTEFFKNRDSNKIIFHCGSGVTACHSLLALDYAGFELPNLYVGSWSEWSRNFDVR
ncbi:sulfurtransferase [Epilithonimonas ginsengisoli]|uniref:Sulfurtransferase n=1 Tax=Epilithonimonas ginsengisoli TaxID=1245592 RepID=A0ABU4JG91_9FLAO|nr:MULTISPECIES: sulfurtransferase [Chryseobacterium group]MBV6880048.1 sulfurtransferase [Epilithonimonas sp. FP105]MDW8548698.1 sulfurtransferase [Epilithonimonas ginsengisoli]OAH75105.1 sulfurtransferase [Chryseobacterium sp. FP211-J200]